MPAKALIKVDGLKEIRREIRRSQKEIKLAVKELDKVTAEEVAAAAAKYVPVRSGRLLRSLKGVGLAKGAEVKAGNNNRLRYASPIHWGWKARGIKRYGFILRGMSDIGRQRGGDFANAYLEKLEKILNERLK